MTSRDTAFLGCFLCTLIVFFKVGNSVDQHYCPNHTFYDNNTINGRIYRNNLDSLLSVLTSNASRPNGFYNFTSGTNDTAVYGLFLCRGDVTASECQDCVAKARSQALSACSTAKKVTVWLDRCLLRYSNQSIFSTAHGEITWLMKNPRIVTQNETALYKQLLSDTFDQIATKAANGGSGKKFAVKETQFKSFEKIFALGQCTPDLSSLDCEACLRRAILTLGHCCSDRLGFRIYNPSCNIRCETSPFYEIPTPPPAPTPNLPPPRPPPASSKVKKERADSRGGLSTRTSVAIVITSTIVAIVAFVVVFARKVKVIEKLKAVEETTDSSSTSIDAESLRCNFSQVQAYTNKFADENKLGEGGFGPVYKGTLPNGRLVAVKRLSRSSAQGAKEFINEIALVAKLQHRNLVRLLGYCLEGLEKILIYELVANRSLDYFLFDDEKRPLLDWLTRYKIIGGITRGLLYLHEESQVKIIHRDLKASNVLLDQNMNPKIADFGLARLFEIDQSKTNTSKIAGTLGYMAPEYAIFGLLSVKSDVFSFGVLVLEIISGKKNSSLQFEDSNDLLTYSWKQWKKGTPLAVVDSSIGDSYNKKEMIRCIQIGLLCVQEDVEQRPTMASIVLMLNSYSITLQNPNPPAYFYKTRTGSLPKDHLSVDQEPITELEAR